jgi:hypothetical protein
VTATTPATSVSTPPTIRKVGEAGSLLLSIGLL